MVTQIEVGTAVLAVVAVLVAYFVLRNAKTLAINAVLGILVLLAANALGLGVQITVLAVIVCALAGVPGAVLVVLLAYLDIAFVATALAPLL